MARSNSAGMKSVPTIKDVAAAAGVSTAAVSKHLNRQQQFSPDVQARIDKAVKSLGYHSNPLARSIITGRSKTIGISIPDIHNPHFASLVKGANRIASQQGYTVLLVDSEEDPEDERRSLADLCMRVDGVIANSRQREEKLDWMKELSKPVVQFGGTQKGMGVSLRNREAGYLVGSYLAKLGHQRIAYIGFDNVPSSNDRYEGIKSRLDEVGLSLQRLDAESSAPQEGERLCASLLLGPARPDAVICFNDMLAFGLIRQAGALGFHIPEDCSVVGFDNVPFCDYLTPRLSSVNMGGERIGEIAAQYLIDILHDRPGTAVMPEPELVLRDSVADRRGDAPRKARSTTQGAKPARQQG